MENLAFDTRVKKEVTRIKKTVSAIDKDLVKLLDSLIKNAAFMAITLEDLRGIISKKGCVSEYKNGENQWGTKKSPEIEIYNTMIKNYAAIIKQLFDLAPEGSNTGGGMLGDFMAKAASVRRPVLK